MVFTLIEKEVGKKPRRIGIDASTVLGEFRLDFGVHFCVAGAVFGEVGG